MSVKAIYENLVKEGWKPKDAAKEAQKRTGLSAVTGKQIKQKKLKFSNEGVTYGKQKTLTKRGFGTKGKFG